MINKDNQYKLTDKDVPERDYPPFRIEGDKRVVEYGKSRITVPRGWHYHMYLVLPFLGSILDLLYLTDVNDQSVVRKMWFEHAKKNVSATDSNPYQATNADVYLLGLASDIELLYSSNSLSEAILKRLKSKNDGEMRGVIYEIWAAAGFIRSGYKISWITVDGAPEFTATKNLTSIDVEAKRRDRTKNLEGSLKQQIRAMRTHIRKALAKDHENRYIVLVDTDIPPASLQENKSLYSEFEKEFKDIELSKTCLILTNSGYEHAKSAIDQGKNSIMVFQGLDSLSKAEITQILRNLYAKLPPAVSNNWII